jgi:hypothetical protein
MAFSSTLVFKTVMGNKSMEVWSFNSAGVTSGNIATGLANIAATKLANKTAQRGVVDDTTTAGTVALTGLTSNDVGYVFVWGHSL